MKKTWLDDTIDLYDFIWEEGTNICGFHVNEQLMEDFKNGGKLFQEMKKKILKRFPTREEALKAFRQKA